MTKYLLFSMAAWFSAGFAPALLGETVDVPAVSGSFKREQPSRFESDVYSVDKRLLQSNEARDTFEYRLTFQAHRDMRDIVLVESLPEGVTLLRAEPVPDRVHENEIFWKVPSLASGTARSLNVTVRTAGVGTFVTQSWVSSDTGVSLPIVTDVPGGLQVTKTGPEYAEPDTVIPFLIKVRNTGTRIARDVQVLEIPPPTLSMGNFQPGVGDLKPGESREIFLTGRTSIKGKHVNLVRAFHADAEAPVEARATVIVADPPQVSFMKRGGGVVNVSQPVTYQILVRNDGEMPLREITVRDTFPAGAQLLSASEGAAVTWPTRAADGHVEWRVGSLGAGQTRLFEFTLIASVPLIVETEARVEGVSPTGKRYGGAATARTQWKGVPGLLTVLVDSKDPVRTGEEVAYRVLLTNQGEHEPITANVVLRLNDFLEAVRVDGVAGATLEGGRVVLPPMVLRPRQDFSCEIVVRGKVSGPGKAALEVRTDFMEEPIVKEEATLVY